MGERSGGQAVSATRVRQNLDGPSTEGDRALAESLQEIDLSEEMTRKSRATYKYIKFTTHCCFKLLFQ